MSEFQDCLLGIQIAYIKGPVTAVAVTTPPSHQRFVRGPRPPGAERALPAELWRRREPLCHPQTSGHFNPELPASRVHPCFVGHGGAGLIPKERGRSICNPRGSNPGPCSLGIVTDLQTDTQTNQENLPKGCRNSKTAFLESRLRI